MTHDRRKSRRFLLHLGAGVAVATMIPIADVTANAATPAEKLAALRLAASESSLQMVRWAEDATPSPVDEPSAGGDGFDNSARHKRKSRK